ncbi:hypothetical protein EV2_007176 [Malus domestica]
MQSYDFKSWKHSTKEGSKLDNTWNATKHGYPRHSTRRSAQGLSKLEILSWHHEGLSSLLTRQKARSHQSGMEWLKDRPH